MIQGRFGTIFSWSKGWTFCRFVLLIPCPRHTNAQLATAQSKGKACLPLKTHTHPIDLTVADWSVSWHVFVYLFCSSSTNAPVVLARADKAALIRGLLCQLHVEYFSKLPCPQPTNFISILFLVVWIMPQLFAGIFTVPLWKFVPKQAVLCTVCTQALLPSYSPHAF